MANTKTKKKTRLRTGDLVQVIAGRGTGARKGEDADRGLRGKVLSIDAAKGRATVQGVRMVFKHQRINKQDPNAPKVGRVERESAVDLSNLMVVCPACDEPSRIGIRIEEVERVGGKKKQNRIRVCRKCGGDLPAGA